MICFCGKFLKPNKEFCNQSCKIKKEEFDSKPFFKAYSHKEAAKYFNLNIRSIKKYFNLKYSLIRRTKECKFCLKQTILSNLSRFGYCKTCSKKQNGRINQSKIVSEKFKGNNNPNYIDGKSSKRNSIRSTSEYKKFIKENKKDYCEISGLKDNLEVHHILPISIFPKYIYWKNNIITICSNLHYEIHKNKLEIEFIKNHKISKQNFIDFIKSKITITNSIHINHYEFIKVLVKNYYKYFSINEIMNITFIDVV